MWFCLPSVALQQDPKRRPENRFILALLLRLLAADKSDFHPSNWFPVFLDLP